MMQNVYLLTGEELSEIIRTAIREELNLILPKEPMNNQDELLTIDDVCKILMISKVTIFSYRKRGILPFHRIGRKVRYKRSEVLAALKKVQMRSEK